MNNKRIFKKAQIEVALYILKSEGNCSKISSKCTLCPIKTKCSIDTHWDEKVRLIKDWLIFRKQI